MSLTKRELAAAIEALRARLAGEIEDTGIPQKAYVNALQKLIQQQEKQDANRQ